MPPAKKKSESVELELPNDLGEMFKVDDDGKVVLTNDELGEMLRRNFTEAGERAGDPLAIAVRVDVDF